MKKQQAVCFAAAGIVLVFACGQLAADPWYAEQGVASWYGKSFQGRKTASSERFSPAEMTAAHRELPLGTKVMVENRETGEKAEVKITDRGPYAEPERRIIDLSRAAADSIGAKKPGLAPVQVVVTELPPPQGTKEEMRYEIQVGAFEEYAEAREVFNQLQAQYAAVYIEPRDGPRGRYHRVRVGPFETKEEAKQVANTLKRQGHGIFLDEVPENSTSK